MLATPTLLLGLWFGRAGRCWSWCRCLVEAGEPRIVLGQNHGGRIRGPESGCLLLGRVSALTPASRLPSVRRRRGGTTQHPGLGETGDCGWARFSGRRRILGADIGGVPPGRAREGMVGELAPEFPLGTARRAYTVGTRRPGLRTPAARRPGRHGPSPWTTRATPERSPMASSRRTSSPDSSPTPSPLHLPRRPLRRRARHCPESPG